MNFFGQISQNIDGFRENNTRILEFIKLYTQNQLEIKFFFFLPKRLLYSISFK